MGIISNKYIIDPLYRNSLFIFINTMTGTILGFLFWTLASRLFSPSDMGISTAIVNAMAIIASLSTLGLNTGIIRYMPNSSKKAEVFNAALTIAAICGLFLGVIFIMFIELFSPSLHFLKRMDFFILFNLFLLFQIGQGFVNYGLLALRKAPYPIIQNIGAGIRIPLLIPFTIFGVIGIISSIGLGYVISFLFGILLLKKFSIKVKPRFHLASIREIIRYSLYTYIADCLFIIQSSILPIIILNSIGAKEAAYFYAAFSIASSLYAVSNSIFMSMLIEGSHELGLRTLIKKSLKASFIVIIPSAIIMFFLGYIPLMIFGGEFSEKGFPVLRALILASPFVTLNALFMDAKRVQKDMKPLIMLAGFLTTSIIIMSYFFMERIGLIGVGIGWLAGQCTTSIIILVIVLKNKIQ
jgi:O-antigen/teichoic acid export membrane protein